jgi:hypothetical protein
LYEDIVRDQRENIVLLMPLAVAFQGVSWWMVHRYPDAMLQGRWHLLLIGLTCSSACTTCMAACSC